MKTLKALFVLLFVVLSSTAFGQYGWFPLQSNWTNWIISVKFLNESTGYAAGWGGYISKSTNGGLNWFSVSPGGTVSYQSCFFIDVNTGWVAGYNGAMIKTTNGGLNWVYQSTGTSSFLMEMKFVNSNTGWAVGYSGTIIKTTNGGNVWATQYTGIENNLTSVVFVNENEGWAAGDYGKVFKTSNGGTNWIPVNIGIYNNTGRMSFVTANTGWIPGTNGIMLKTTNGGNSWNLLNTGTTNYLIMANFLNASTGFTIGAYGTVLRTNNGGDNWFTQSSGSSNNLREICLLNSSTGWIAGDNGTLLKTTTGGLSVPNPPQLISPPDNALSQSLTPTMIWSNTGGNSYCIQISTNPSFNVITDSATLLTTQYVIPSGKLQQGITYFWRVNSRNPVGVSNWSSIWNFATYTGPSAPTLIYPANGAINVPLMPTFTWTDVSTALYYVIQISTDSLFGTIIDSSTIYNNQYTEQPGKLNSGILYFWRVKAFNNNGSGPWSDIWKFTTASVPPAPILVYPTNGMLGLNPTPTLNWDSLITAMYYKVQISTVSNFAILTDSGTVTESQYTVPSGKLVLNYTYFWRVNGSNAMGVGPWSQVWRFTVSPTGIILNGNSIPNEFKLYSNYPNPFNPVTKIKFDLPKKSYTSLIVYNLLGKTVETLVNTELKEGSYEYTWSAEKYNSGVYFVRLVSDKFVETRKMVLLK